MSNIQHTTYMYSMDYYCNIVICYCILELLEEIMLIFLFVFIEDEGYEFNINCQIRKFRGTITYISGDNLGSQQIGGFKEGSQAYRKCRECIATADEISLPRY